MTRNDIAETIFATALLALAGLLLLSSGAFAAETLTSAYTRFDADKCAHQAGSADEDYGSWHCRGYRGIPVLLSAGDQRMNVTFGKTGSGNLAESESFPGFNNVYKGTVEWRLAAGNPTPFATILEWNVMTQADQEKADGPTPSTGRVLVVTRLGKGGICHVGYVDVRANAGSANELARQIADNHARSFQCGKDKPIVLGAVSPGLGMPGKGQ